MLKKQKMENLEKYGSVLGRSSKTVSSDSSSNETNTKALGKQSSRLRPGEYVKEI